MRSIWDGRPMKVKLTSIQKLEAVKFDNMIRNLDALIETLDVSRSLLHLSSRSNVVRKDHDESTASSEKSRAFTIA